MFQVGDKIVHPMHGAGVVDGIVEKQINGITREYYLLRIPIGGMVVLIPTAGSAGIGVRAVVGRQEAEQLLGELSEIRVEEIQNWNQRYRENMLKLKSGDLRAVAGVVKGLMLREVDRGLSTGERKMLHSAKQILLSELVLAQSITYEEAEARINGALHS